MRPWEAHGPLRAPHDQGLSMTFMVHFFQKKKKGLKILFCDCVAVKKNKIQAEFYPFLPPLFFFFSSFFSLKF